MKTDSFRVIEAFLARERRPREVAAKLSSQVVDFLKEQTQAVHVVNWQRGQRAPGTEIGSCTRFEIYFDANWQPSPTEVPDDGVRFVVGLAASDRGPFVVAFGYERRLKERPEPWEAGKLIPQRSDIATAKAHSIALAVADQFGLTCLDSEWLRSIEIDPESLSRDAATSLDYSEPNALNILFAEDL